MSSIPFSVAFITPGSFDVIAFSIRPPSCTSLCSVRSSDCSMQSAVFLPLYPLPHKTSEYRFLSMLKSVIIIPPIFICINNIIYVYAY